MNELTKLLTKIELTADDIIDTRQQIVNLDARRHKTREALNRLKEQREKDSNPSKKHWICVGDMFIRLNPNDTRNLIFDDHYHTEQGVEKLRDELKEKVEGLRQLEVRWPDYFIVGEHPNGDMMAYIMGKIEGDGEDWHGHVTALSVASIYRRTNLAAKLMTELEDVSERKEAYFVDLFVRQSNQVAVTTYERLGYSVYRRVLDYYSGDPDEDALDMRKALSRDTHKRSIRPLTHPVRACDV